MSGRCPCGRSLGGHSTRCSYCLGEFEEFDGQQIGRPRMTQTGVDFEQFVGEQREEVANPIEPMEPADANLIAPAGVIQTVVPGSFMPPDIGGPVTPPIPISPPPPPPNPEPIRTTRWILQRLINRVVQVARPTNRQLQVGEPPIGVNEDHDSGGQVDGVINPSALTEANAPAPSVTLDIPNSDNILQGVAGPEVAAGADPAGSYVPSNVDGLVAEPAPIPSLLPPVPNQENNGIDIGIVQALENGVVQVPADGQIRTLAQAILGLITQARDSILRRMGYFAA